MFTKDRNLMGLNTNLLSLLMTVSIFTFIACESQKHDQNGSADYSQNRNALATEFRDSLETGILSHWYPRVIDTVYGGYLSRLSYDWKPLGNQDKMIVTQARHIWTLSEASKIFPEKREAYHEMARQGIRFLWEKMWDHQNGGFYSLVNRKGNIKHGNDSFTGSKTAYGNSFAIYGLTHYAEVFGDSTAMDYARQTFRWLDSHAHDSQYGGYFQNLKRDGTPYESGFNGQPPKDQNSSIHLLEAFTTLYRAWPDTVVRNRLSELLTLVRDTITTPRHHLTLFFRSDWTPVSYQDSIKNGKPEFFQHDHISFGHDVETAYLMLEAAEALGIDREPTLIAGKAMVDEALKYGWDGQNGGMFDAAYYVEPDGPMQIVKRTKVWWSQAEVLNSFLLMSEFFPDDERQYYRHFLRQWDYIKQNIMDHQHGGWYWSGIDMEPEQKQQPKGTIWKGTYHNSRALINGMEMLVERRIR